MPWYTKSTEDGSEKEDVSPQLWTQKNFESSLWCLSGPKAVANSHSDLSKTDFVY